MTKATLTDVQSAVQAASDRLADALLDGSDTSEARTALDQARDALAKHQDALQASERERQAAKAALEAAESAEAEVAAVNKAVDAVTNTVKRVQLPEGVEPPAPTEHPIVATAAAEVARLKLDIERGKPGHKEVADEVAALTTRANAKRAEANAIRSRRLAGYEEAGDAAALHLLEADANDLESLVQAATQRMHALGQPIAELRQRLAVAERNLKAAQVEAALHGQADRVRVLEAALIDAVRELRGSMLKVGFTNLPNFFSPTEELRKISYGAAV